jgi:hypothetical protein
MQSNRLMRSSMDVTIRAFDPFSFAQRHIGPQADDVRRMLQVVNAPSLDALIDEACLPTFAKLGRSALDRRCPNPSSWPKCAGSFRATSRWSP